MIGGNAIIRITATVMAIRNGHKFLIISVIGVSPTFDATKSMLPACGAGGRYFLSPYIESW